MLRLTHTAAVLLLAVLAGCQRSVVTDPIRVDYPPEDVDAELDFWAAMETRPFVSNNEGLHGLFLLADGQDTSTGFEDRVLKAKERNWLPADWTEPEGMSMQRGMMARAVVVIARIKGGVWMQLLGPTKRYATRELVDMQIMSDNSTENLSITGLEYVSVISRARDHILMQQTGGQPAPTDAVPEATPAEPPPAAATPAA